MYKRVVTVRGDEQANAYLRQRWTIISANVYEQVLERNPTSGHPKAVRVLTVYVMGEPGEAVADFIDKLEVESVVSPEAVEAAISEEARKRITRRMPL